MLACKKTLITYLQIGADFIELFHKYSETDSDPYNTKRGLFFANVTAGCF